MWRKLPLALQCDKNKFTNFISSPSCSYSSSRHRSNEAKNYVMNLEVEGKIDVLMGLASASVKYRHKDETSSKREVIYLSSSVYARKGFLITCKETPKYTDKGVDFNIEGIEIGMEDILIVTAEYERDDKRTENTTEYKARVLFFSISGKLESIHKDSKIRGCVRIHHYSSSSQEWEEPMEFDGNSYSQALDEIKRIEDDMRDIPNIVRRTPHDALPSLRMVVTPNVADGSNIAVYLELHEKMNEIQVMLAGVNESTDCCSDSEVDKLKGLLEELQDVDVRNCSWDFLESIMTK